MKTDKLLKKSAENKKNLIPEGYESRLRSLLDSLPDEVPVSGDAQAEVVRKARRFDIRPLVSAAAAFAVVAAGVLAVRNGVQPALDGGHESGKTYVTTAVSETTALTTSVSVTETAVTSDTSESVTSETSAPVQEKPVSERVNEPAHPSAPVSVPAVHEEKPPVSPAAPDDVPSPPVPPEHEVPVPGNHPEDEHPHVPGGENEHPDVPPAVTHPDHPDAPVPPGLENRPEREEKDDRNDKDEKDEKDRIKDREKTEDDEVVLPFADGMAHMPHIHTPVQ